MVGTGIVLSPHKYFQFDRTLKNVVVNSESAFWIFLEKHLLGYFPKRLLEGLGAKKPPWRAPQEGCGRPHVWVLHGAPLAPLIPFMPLWISPYMGIFGILEVPILPLAFPINRGGEGCHKLIPCSHTHAMLC